MPVSRKALPLLLILFSACAETTAISECNPESGRFIKGDHYVAGDLLTEEQNWNLLAFQRYMSKREKLFPDPDCIPITAPLSFEQKLYQMLEDIDFQGNRNISSANN